MKVQELSNVLKMLPLEMDIDVFVRDISNNDTIVSTMTDYYAKDIISREEIRMMCLRETACYASSSQSVAEAIESRLAMAKQFENYIVNGATNGKVP